MDRSSQRAARMWATNRLWGAALLLAGAPVWAVTKCTGADGRVSFQDTPCGSAAKAESVDVRVHNSVPGLRLPPPAPAPAVPDPVPAPPAALWPPPPSRTPLEVEAEMCLNWYRPLLRDPAGAYYSEARKELRVVSITLHGTNGFGGYVARTAACEIHGGRLNESWTRIHAERAGWVPR